LAYGAQPQALQGVRQPFLQGVQRPLFVVCGGATASVQQLAQWRQQLAAQVAS